MKAYLLKESLGAVVDLPLEGAMLAVPAELDRSTADGNGLVPFSKPRPPAAGSPGWHPERTVARRYASGVVEAINGNIKTLLEGAWATKKLDYLLLKAQRMAAPRPNFIVLQKARPKMRVSTNSRAEPFIFKGRSDGHFRSSHNQCTM